ncbi:MAG: hypothetical protein JJD97_11420, partial [Gemmatimonadaceae bacterium]|nr:hypothetical protein [Gemmatimonadaceae bacterium]
GPQGVEPPRPKAAVHHLEAPSHQQHVGVALVGAPEVGIARAQRVAPEARLDAIIAHRSALQAALGADIAVSPSMHLELAAGVGPSFAGGAGTVLSARGDAIVHFLIDPQHRMHWSPYAGAGIGGRYDRGPGWRGVAIVALGVNAPKWKHAVPFIEAGFGGGVRIGAGIRRGR